MRRQICKKALVAGFRVSGWKQLSNSEISTKKDSVGDLWHGIWCGCYHSWERDVRLKLCRVVDRACHVG